MCLLQRRENDALFVYRTLVEDLDDRRIRGIGRAGWRPIDRLNFFDDVADELRDDKVINDLLEQGWPRFQDDEDDPNTDLENESDDSSEDEQEKAEKASLTTARYLWNFLSGMSTKHKIQAAA